MKWLRYRMTRYVLLLITLALALLAADTLCYQVALPVEVDVRQGTATLYVGSEVVPLGAFGTPTLLQFPAHDSAVHEYQIDGSDSTNNFTLDPTYIASIASSPYYRFQSWMRDLEGTSRWRNLQVWADGRVQNSVTWPVNGSYVSLPNAQNLRISVQLQRPETPMSLSIVSVGGETVTIRLDRNDRQIQVSHAQSGQSSASQPTTPTTTFFPTDPLPFAAMVFDTLIRITLWAILVLLVVIFGDMAFGFMIAWWGRGRDKSVPTGADVPGRDRFITSAPSIRRNSAIWFIAGGWRRLTTALHPVALIALGCSLVFVSWIALVQYNAEPHIFDASAYLFAAKMYALGRFSVPIPAAIDRFPGPFMVQYNGQWFGQYAPGTGLTLVPGIWLGVPWLVEPVLGTFALLGIGLIAARLYDRRVATVAVLLGTLSPFYSYLAASYLSHAIALFYFVWGTWALLRFAQGGAKWNMPLSAALFGMAGLTRDLVAVLYVAIVLPGILLLMWRDVRRDWRRWIMPLVAFFSVICIFAAFYGIFNGLLTGSPLVTPRSLFFAGDRWGFGQGVGFYGQHTLAAGFANLDELLTSLQIDLYGWPFYLTLVFLAIPFLTGRCKGVDWFMLIAAAILTGAYIGYFYHGIYLGPRYLFESLPFLLILTARGIFVLASVASDARHAITRWFASRRGETLTAQRPRASFMTIALITVLLACNLIYYMPRQIALHQDFSGYPAGYSLNLPEIYHLPLHNAIVVTDDFFLYQMVLFPLNDPLLRGNVLYALASSQADYNELRSAYPGRALYQLIVGPDGNVSYYKLPSS